MDTIRTVLLRADDHFNYSSQWTGTKQNTHHFDQAELEDSVITASIGRPVYRNAVGAIKRSHIGGPPKSFVARNGQSLTYDQVLRNNLELTSYIKRGTFYDALLNKTFLASLGWIDLPPSDKRMWSGNLTIPNLNYGYPEELGGAIFPNPDKPSGPYSDAWIKTLKEDCPEQQCPWWNERRPLDQPDPFTQLFSDGDFSKINAEKIERELNMFVDPKIKQETMGNMPRYVLSSMLVSRWGLSLGPGAEEKYRKMQMQSVAHIHQFHGGEVSPSSFWDIYPSPMTLTDPADPSSYLFSLVRWSIVSCEQCTTILLE